MVEGENFSLRDNPKALGLKTANIFHLTISMGQESEGDLAIHMPPAQGISCLALPHQIWIKFECQTNNK